jgi:hypothetical protein
VDVPMGRVSCGFHPIAGGTVSAKRNTAGGRCRCHFRNSNERDKHMKTTVRSGIACLLLTILPGILLARDNSYSVTYDGGSVANMKAGNAIKLFVEPTQFRFVKDKEDLLVVPASAITEITYGQDVHRRVGAAIGLAVVSFGIGALMALTKSKKHFIGVTWSDGDKKGGLAIQCDKNEYRGILSGLEGISGKKAVDSSAMTVKN